jgi:ABC-type lipoprotein release transport system permease subunit
MRLAIAGVIIGIGAAFGLTRFISSFLYGVKTWDPLVFVTVPVLLFLVALLAVWMPATRASRLDPQQALRIE